MEFKPVKHVKLCLTVVADKLIVAGADTFALKESIKLAGGKWQADNKRWAIPYPSDTSILENAIKALSEERSAARSAAIAAGKAQRAYDATPEGKAAIAARKKAQVAAAFADRVTYHWICCADAEVIDWGRRHTSCDKHAVWDGQSWSTFRVNGSIYTGT